MEPGIEIDQVVREVLNRLGQGTFVSTARGNGAAKSATRQDKTESANGAGTVVLNDPVISAQVLKGRLDGTKTIVVPSQAVLTPSARDLLKELQIAVQRNGGQAAKVTATLVFALAATDYEAEGLLRAVAGECGEIERMEHGKRAKLPEMIQALAAEVAGGEKRGVLLTALPSPALCLANRHSGVRAAWGVSGQAVREAIETVAANLLIVDPARHGVFELKQMIRDFGRGSNCPPEEYRNWL